VVRLQALEVLRKASPNLLVPHADALNIALETIEDTGGFDTRHLKEAKALLEELSV
jgi:hypothetical protein